jgi:cell division initiation protein
MIEQKEFQVIPQNGYDPDEVDRFLDEIVDELEQLQRELKTLKTESNRRPAATAASVTSSLASEETVRSMLINAQRVCDDTISDAKKRAEDALKQARDEADQILQSARTEESALNAENDALRAAVSDYRSSFRRLIDDQRRWLDEEM